MRPTTLLRILFYGGLFLLIVGILTGAVGEVLPAVLANHVIRNDEGYVLLVMIVGWIEFVRPRLGRSPGSLIWLVVVSGVLSAVGVAMLEKRMTPAVNTLNESFFAVAVLIFWIALPRPVPRRAWILPGLAVGIAVAYGDDVYRMAEFFAALVVFPIGWELVHRSILRPGVRTSALALIVWCLGLSAAAIALHLARPAHPSGVVQNVVLFLSRDPEAVIAVVGMHAYFALSHYLDARASARKRTATTAPPGHPNRQTALFGAGGNEWEESGQPCAFG